MKKKLFALVCACTLALGLTACGSTTYSEEDISMMERAEEYASYGIEIAQNLATDSESVTSLTDSYNKEEMAYLYQYYFYTLTGGSYQDEAELGALDGLLTTYAQMSSDMGGVVGVGTATTEISGDEITVTYPVTGVNCNGEMTFTYTNDIFFRFTEGNCEAHTSFSQKMHEAGTHMSTAALNTVLGMGTVFIMLIVISFIISLFENFSKIGKKKTAPEAPKAAPAAVETQEEEVSDDTELVAVIMAAISAYEGTSSDGYVVRSIKKVNRRK